ncbi:hypothetical protein GGR35_003036 [Mucilaginibacter phyllosphaerae]|uniref:Uncharacterized protein n=1 Tax=Mucilaginibacter phyllosphaerae TaxID=1812349 RepID=A0ABR6IBI5_9SPHI|nr:hypothetical protein [Mucilaginibacter phyllosphaerae]
MQLLNILIHHFNLLTGLNNFAVGNKAPFYRNKHLLVQEYH